MSTPPNWSLHGACGEPILGNTHVPSGPPAGVLLLAHGFKGYKDYGFFPYLAQTAAESGLVAHRFNFSHSGMTNRIETFERPDLFQRDTWGKQIEDLSAVASAVKSGELPGSKDGLPVVWFGHSRGGVTTILAAWRVFDEKPKDLDAPAGVIAAASPHASSHLSEDQQAELKRRGSLDSPSSRTGQLLRIGVDALLEVEKDPKNFDPIEAISHFACPLWIVHGDDDQTVHVSAARRLADAAGANATLQTIPGASHTFNAPNPLPPDGPVPEATRQMAHGVCRFAMGICEERSNARWEVSP